MVLFEEFFNKLEVTHPKKMGYISPKPKVDSSNWEDIHITHSLQLRK